MFFILPDDLSCYLLIFFFFNDTATTEIYTLSLHDALPIRLACASLERALASASSVSLSPSAFSGGAASIPPDRKSTRLNSSHGYISYAVFCLKKKKKKKNDLLLTKRTQITNE